MKLKRPRKRVFIVKNNKKRRKLCVPEEETQTTATRSRRDPEQRKKPQRKSHIRDGTGKQLDKDYRSRNTMEQEKE